MDKSDKELAERIYESHLNNNKVLASVFLELENYLKQKNHSESSRKAFFRDIVSEMKKAIKITIQEARKQVAEEKCYWEKLLEDNTREVKKEVNRRMTGVGGSGWRNSVYGECIWVTSVIMLDVLREKLKSEVR